MSETITHRLASLDWQSSFPWNLHTKIRPNQETALNFIESNCDATLEIPPGEGKTVIGYTFLKALARQGKSPLFFITPTKGLVEQVRKMHPDVTVALGRNEHPCLFYG